MKTKLCSKCRKTKSTDNFTKNDARPDGYNYWCRSCLSKYNKNNPNRYRADYQHNYYERVTLPKRHLKSFIKQSNKIEDVGDEGFADSMKAWEYLSNVLIIEAVDILECHRIVMQTLDPRIAGEIRNCSVRVGQFIKSHFSIIKETLPDVIEQLNGVDPKQAHIAFEMLHPFEDGNGRVGRLLYFWQRMRLGLPTHIIYYKERFKYYKWFQEAEIMNRVNELCREICKTN